MHRTPLLRRRGSAEGAGWLFFGLRRLLVCGYQRTTTRSLRSPPSFAGGQLLLHLYLFIFLCRSVNSINYFDSFSGFG
ncbi:MAG TPA: hypothetical protein VK616_07370, partial [Flavitalea sp.]|nr:hypothetical protein [Flavitalea sp.]